MKIIYLLFLTVLFFGSISNADTAPDELIRRVKSYLNNKNIIIGVYQCSDSESLKSFSEKLTEEDAQAAIREQGTQNSKMFHLLSGIKGETPKFILVKKFSLRREQLPFISFVPLKGSIWILFLEPINETKLSNQSIITYKTVSWADNIFLLKWPKDELQYKSMGVMEISEKDLPRIFDQIQNITGSNINIDIINEALKRTP